MTRDLPLTPTVCAICGAGAPSAEVYPAALDRATFDPAVFSARRAPDRRHYRIVRCRVCGLVRSDPIAPAATLDRLYRDSHFSYERETEWLRRTYRRALDRTLRAGARAGRLLEIGAGNGFFLHEALAAGFTTVRGVEPSHEAVEQATPNIRSQLVCGTFGPGLFRSSTFDVVCAFQVFDHLPDPRACLAACADVLTPGGYVLMIAHDVRAWSARVMGQRSPIFDVEHTFLYNPDTMARLFALNGFEVVRAGRVLNTCSIAHLAWLAPLPPAAKRAVSRVLTWTGIGSRGLSLPLGNLEIIARTPAASSS